MFTFGGGFDDGHRPVDVVEGDRRKLLHKETRHGASG